MHAKDAGDKGGCTGILRTIEQEEKKTMWHQINRAINDPSLGAVPFVQKLVQGQVVDIYEAEEMNREIQVTTEKRFDLSMSTPITMTSLWECLVFLSDTDFAMSMLRGEAHIPSDVDNATTIINLFCKLHDGHAEIFLGVDEFHFYWRRVWETASSAISRIHFVQYKSATYSNVVTNFLAKKISLIARSGCVPE
jgi:hypothetical protein